MISWEDFLTLAREQFGFLELDYGFVCTSDKAPFLTFSSENIDIGIFYDINRRGELDLGIRRKRDMGKHIPSFGIYEFKRLVGLADKKMSPFPKTKEEMWQELNILAKDLKTYCQSVLKGDMSDFSVIEKERKEAEWRYTQ